MSLKHKKYIFFLSFCFFILVVTILDRRMGLCHQYELMPFLSYRKAFLGDKQIGKQIVLNIGLFIPFGFFLGLVRGKKKLDLPIAAFGFLCSLSVELIQLIFCLGIFEFDDLFDNTLGALIGAVLYRCLVKALPFEKIVGKLPSAVILLLTAGFLVGSCMYGWSERRRGESTVDLKRDFYIRVDEENFESKKDVITGACFIFHSRTSGFTIRLRSCESGEYYSLSTTTGLARTDVNDYFACEYDYLRCGFEAKLEGIDLQEAYEIYVDWNWKPRVSTGLYLVDGKVSFTKEKTGSSDAFQGTYMERVVCDGVLLINREDIDLSIYQYQGKLFLIAGSGFSFDKQSRRTRIYCHLWTTQLEKLPRERVEKEWYWDNKDFTFEKNEIKATYGDYRVAVLRLPSGYPISKMVLGTNSDTSWVEYIRPVLVQGENGLELK